MNLDKCVSCARLIGEDEARQLQVRDTPDWELVKSCLDSHFYVVACCLDCRDGDKHVFVNANEAAGLIARKGFWPILGVDC